MKIITCGVEPKALCLRGGDPQGGGGREGGAGRGGGRGEPVPPAVHSRHPVQS